MTAVASCVFCRIIAKTATATIVREWPDAIAFTPLNPCTPGHTLVVPRAHVARADTDPAITGATFTRAAQLAAQQGGDHNLIVNAGELASQTVPHLHVHYVPRRAGDGLALPWPNHGQA
ncbi:MAG: HIT family protein [Phycicoccus sp.]